MDTALTAGAALTSPESTGDLRVSENFGQYDALLRQHSVNRFQPVVGGENWSTRKGEVAPTRSLFFNQPAGDDVTVLVEQRPESVAATVSR